MGQYAFFWGRMFVRAAVCHSVYQYGFAADGAYVFLLQSAPVYTSGLMAHN